MSNILLEALCKYEMGVCGGQNNVKQELRYQKPELCKTLYKFIFSNTTIYNNAFFLFFQMLPISAQTVCLPSLILRLVFGWFILLS